MENNNIDSNDDVTKKHKGRTHRRGHRRGQVRGRMRGRPRVAPNVQFQWDQISGHVIIKLSQLELECLRLCDSVGLTQEEAANTLDVSRGTIWRSLSSARQSLATTIQKGRTIEIELSNND
ncbi:MAG: DUF134 domain-containing protein [Candidatus Heimdallarchaeota archaeon]|nr:DUF134 domain-containing protein [Candidatus Heimdallarchaeota archaeon]